MYKKLLQPRHFLSLLVLLCFLVAGVRLNNIWDILINGKLFQGTPPVQAATEPKVEEKKEEKKEERKEPAPRVSKGEETELTVGEMELAKQLSSRRDQLDQRSQALDTREALLRVAEQRVDEKIKELEILRTQLQAMVNQVSGVQQAQIDNLVKIYETMKPKEAAKIFETLELPVLLGVVQKMKPQRTAAVMAEMSPEKAKEITVALTRQDQLPQIK